MSKCAVSLPVKSIVTRTFAVEVMQGKNMRIELSKSMFHTRIFQRCVIFLNFLFQGTETAEDLRVQTLYYICEACNSGKKEDATYVPSLWGHSSPTCKLQVDPFLYEGLKGTILGNASSCRRVLSVKEGKRTYFCARSSFYFACWQD